LEHSYWLARTITALDSADRAASNEARLFHLELAGCYTTMARAVAKQKRRQCDAAPQPALSNATGGLTRKS
jgi:hypothetical protein